MAILSDYCLRAPLRTNETPTVVLVPEGMTKVAFWTESLTFYARKGSVDAELPSGTLVNDGSASFPYQGGVVHESAVTGGERLTFVTSTEVQATLVLAFA